MSSSTISQNVNFGKALRNAQANSYMRISDIARQMKVAPQQVSRWQKNDDIKLSRAIQIAAIFGMTLAEFIDAYNE